jgi:hypothetical protein
MMANRSIHALLVEDNPVDTRLLFERVKEVPSVQFTWEHVLRLEQAKTFCA